MYGKIFEQIFDSSIAEDWQVRHVFMDMIVLADVNGVVDRTLESISRRTNVPLEVVKRAISTLENNDPSSRSPEENGARIRRLDEHRQWGWEIVNYQKYREIASDEQRREKTKLRTRKWRNINDNRTCDAPVTLCDARDAMQKQKQKHMQKQKKGGEENGIPPVERISLEKELERVIKCMKSIRDSYDSCTTWSEIDKMNFELAKERKREIQQLLGAKY